MTEKVEVGRASAVGGPKPRQGFRGPLCPRQGRRPLMLAALGVVAQPNALDLRVSSDIVDMPVRPLGDALVMPEASAKASRPQSATKVNVEPALQAHVAEPSDLDRHMLNTSKDEGVGARLWSHIAARVHCEPRGTRRLDSSRRLVRSASASKCLI